MEELIVTPGRHGPFRGRLATDVIAAYAIATGDRTAGVRDGLAVPAVFPAILVFTAQEAARADLPAAIRHRVRDGVHGEHDIVLHRPLVPGEPLDTYSCISAIRTSRAGTHVVVHLAEVAADGQVAVDQWWTMILLGLTGMANSAIYRPITGSPNSARTKPLGSIGRRIDAELAHRYARVSGDWAPHHFDLEVAQAAGFRFRVHARSVHDGGLHPPASAPSRHRRPWPDRAGGGAFRVADTVGCGADGWNCGHDLRSPVDRHPTGPQRQCHRCAAMASSCHFSQFSMRCR
jgi:MaoC like domain